jgi:hypothetical protein
MQKLRAMIATRNISVATILYGAVLGGSFAASHSGQASAAEAGPAAADCDSDKIVLYQAEQSPETSATCASDVEIVTQDRDYLIETSTPGTTMMRQGPELAIGRLHPEFVRRLAAAIHEARRTGLLSVGVFSAYRPPAFGVGGFSNKFNSLHTYGLAVDMSGIGGPGTVEAKLWYEIAAKHGVTCPYGFENRVEWNHCQPTHLKIIVPESPLRDTVTASGPIDLDSMFEAGNALIESPESVADAAHSDIVGPATSGHPEVAGSRLSEQSEEVGNISAGRRSGKMNSFARKAGNGLLPERPSWCKQLHQPRKEVCGDSHQVETAARGVQSRQASTSASRHRT